MDKHWLDNRLSNKRLHRLAPRRFHLPRDSDLKTWVLIRLFRPEMHAASDRPIPGSA